MVFKSRLTSFPGFTLLELLVSLLISAILMGLTVYTLNSFRKISFVYGLQQQTLHRIMTLHRLLVQDFSRSQKINRTRNGITVSYSNNTVEYLFNKEEHIVRKQNNLSDEFPFEAELVQLLYKQNPTYLYNEIIDELRFEVEIEGEILPFSFYKIYASDILIENELREK